MALSKSLRALLMSPLLIGVGGCEFIEEAAPQPAPARVEGFDLNVPRIMRGTIAAEAALRGYDWTYSPNYTPVVAWGYGLVVGLNGTGSGDLPPALRAHMRQEAIDRGIGSARTGYAHLDPDQMLSSTDTAVVIVEAVIPQGAVEGSRFDIRVYADPRSGTTSLDGGRLYTTELRPKVSTDPLPPIGGGQAFSIAEAGGPIFINPFAEPGASGRDSINRTTGRILNGGVITEAMTIKLRLTQPSHSRASIMQSAINAQFPQEPGQEDPTARGESGEQIDLTIPPSFMGREEEFVELLMHTTIRKSGVEAVASSIRRIVLADPSVASDAAWRWQALGKRAIPIIRDLYDHPEELPRMAALKAGSALGDGLVIQPLIGMSSHGSVERRLQAITLLENFVLNPSIDVALRDLLNDLDVEVRLRAYEALIERGDPFMDRRVIDGKFVLDIVESDKPMIYITQLGEPRIVLFGLDLAVERPITMRAWSNRLMIRADTADDDMEIYYRGVNEIEGVVHRVEPSMEELVQFFGHDTTIEAPSPGLGLSYGETVGAIHQIWSQKYIDADFKAEQDRVLAAILRQQRETRMYDRPEFSDPGPEAGGETDGSGGAVSDLDRIAPPPLSRPETASAEDPGQ